MEEELKRKESQVNRITLEHNQQQVQLFNGHPVVITKASKAQVDKVDVQVPTRILKKRPAKQKDDDRMEIDDENDIQHQHDSISTITSIRMKN